LAQPKNILLVNGVVAGQIADRPEIGNRQRAPFAFAQRASPEQNVLRQRQVESGIGQQFWSNHQTGLLGRRVQCVNGQQVFPFAQQRHGRGDIQFDVVKRLAARPRGHGNRIKASLTGDSSPSDLMTVHIGDEAIGILQAKPQLIERR
jgi:hypothetical protein